MANGNDDRIGEQYAGFLLWAREGVREGLRVAEQDYRANADERSVAANLLHEVARRLVPC